MGGIFGVVKANMIDSVFNNYTNPDASANISYPYASMLAHRALRFTRWHLRYAFLPPTSASVVLRPIDEKAFVEDAVDTSLFVEGSPYFERHLNFYIRVAVMGGQSGSVNAGYLGTRFMLGDRYGYETLKDLTTYIKTHTSDDQAKGL